MQIAIFNPVPGIAVEAQLAQGEKVSVPYGKSAVLKNLPISSKQLAVSIVQKNEVPFQFHLPLDFKDGNHLSVVIIQDRHGRPMPRSIFSGYVYSPPPPPEKPFP